MDTVDEVQKSALIYCYKKSKSYSRNIKGSLITKLIEDGYTKSDMDLALDYIRKTSQSVIQFDHQLLDCFLTDDRYRNQFETGTSRGTLSGETRQLWEANLFNSLYTPDCRGNRVKYGCINLLNDISGVSPAYGYGTSHLVLKQETKIRTSIYYGDTSSMDMHIATFKYPHVILYYLSKEQLTNLVKKANGQNISISPYSGIYIETQIHGDVLFGRDIEKVVVPRNLVNDSDINKLEQFKTKFGVNYEFY